MMRALPFAAFLAAFTFISVLVGGLIAAAPAPSIVRGR